MVPNCPTLLLEAQESQALDISTIFPWDDAGIGSSFVIASRQQTNDPDHHPHTSTDLKSEGVRQFPYQ